MKTKLLLLLLAMGAGASQAVNRVPEAKPHPEELSTAQEEADEDDRETRDPSVNPARADTPEPDGAIPTEGYLPLASDSATVVSSSTAPVKK
jgi:hypothetical protein